ncbi:alkaline phosphatase family protein [Agromyces humatus]|uniref:Alkaline phosphatase family protein n=1 Tax=Agromyces humatus TaxID=279573 RepID=A0ABN2KX38_9MICO|nr:alkaline phosphatase family protein [Agromyces humatus]
MNARLRAIVLVAAAASAAFGVVLGGTGAAASESSPRPATPVEHFISVMQGGATFDHYFGTYEGADGIPADACQPVASADCVQPFALHGTHPAPLRDIGGIEHAQYNDGAMDGFAAAFEGAGLDRRAPMGYFDRRDLPVSWRLAEEYVLFDRFFASSQDGARTNRSFWVAAAPPRQVATNDTTAAPIDQPTIFDRLDSAGVSWKFYVQDYDPAETFQARRGSMPATQTVRVPLLEQERFVTDPAFASHIVDLAEYRSDLATGTLPAVSFVAASRSGERSPASIPAGQRLLGGMVDALAASRYWTSSAMLITYDAPGGWYDHVPPPTAADGGLLGFRVPALLVGAHVRSGVVDSTPLDSTAGLAFVERNWGLEPLSARDAGSIGLESAFDFSAPAREATIIAPAPESTPSSAVRTEPVTRLYGAAAIAGLAVIGIAYLSRRVRRGRRGSAAPATLPSSERPP